MSNALLSIVIPTKNRYENLKILLKSILEFSNSDLEIIIQDNSDNNEEFIKEYNSLGKYNIKYFYDRKWKSVVDNCNDGIINSSGEYITLIGDDDAFTPQILDIVRLMKKYDLKSCSCEYSLFRWDKARGQGQYAFEYYNQNYVIKTIDIDKSIKRLMNGGIQNRSNMPGVYHGIVARDILDKVYIKAGSFFPGPSPDMANSFGVSTFLEKHIVVSAPFIVDGYSKASTGHLTEKKKHIGALKDQAFLPKDTIDTWDEKIPDIWLPNTIWPDSAINAIKKCGKTDWLKYMNYSALYIKIQKIYPECKDLCKQYVRSEKKTKYIASYFQVAIRYIINKVKHAIKKRKAILSNDVETIKASEKIIYENNICELIDNKLNKLYLKKREK